MEASSGVSSAALKFTTHASFCFDLSTQSWTAVEAGDQSSPVQDSPAQDSPARLIVASYNVSSPFKWDKRDCSLQRTLTSDRAAADILVLQQVTNPLLGSLLADSSISSKYPFSSHGASSVGNQPAERHLVVLSRFPFRWSRPLSNAGSVVATFPTLMHLGSANASLAPLILAACQLNAELNNEAVMSKKDEIQKLIEYMDINFHGHPWVIAGCFNLPSSRGTLDRARQMGDISTASYEYLQDSDAAFRKWGIQDAWLVSRITSGESSSHPLRDQHQCDEQYEGEQGATYDPLVNTLAFEMTGGGLDNRPQRYDRILVSDELRIRPSRFNMFGFPSEATAGGGIPASSHWGIRCLLEEPSTEYPEPIKPMLVKAPPSLRSTSYIEDALRRRHCLPTHIEAHEREQAVQTLERVLKCMGPSARDANHRNSPRLILAPFGSFSLGVWAPSSDVNCLCIGEISEDVFISLAVARIRRASGDGTTYLRTVRTGPGLMLELDVNCVRVDVQYCCAPTLLDRFPDVLNRPVSDPAFALSPQILSRIKSLRDMHYLQRSVPDMAQYRTAHLLLRAWAQSRGLYGSRFGLLGSIHISAMLVPICKSLSYYHGSVTVGDILLTFFHHYAHFDWERNVVSDPFFDRAQRYHRLSRESLCLLGWHGPSLNTASRMAGSAASILATEFRLAEMRLSTQMTTWDEFLEPFMPEEKQENRLPKGVLDFLQGYKSFAKVSVLFWGSSTAAGAEFVAWVASRCAVLLDDLDVKIPSSTTRIWPQRLTDKSEDQGSDNSPRCHGYYLIGLGRHQGQAPLKTARVTENELRDALGRFEMGVRGNEKYYDADHCFVSAELVRRNELGAVRIDGTHPGDLLGDYGLPEVEVVEEDPDAGEEEDEEDMQAKGDGGAHLSTVPGHDGCLEDGGNPPHPKAGKLRSAGDVMSRLRWDHDIDASDHVVGYEDRFTGLRERALEDWRGEQTDNDFIPQHRIVYFKRRSDGVVVWDRRTRMDHVFGSGGSSACVGGA